VTKLISEHRVDDIVQVQRSGVDGMQTFDMHLVGLVKNNVVALEEALDVVEDQSAFNRLLKGRSSGGDRGGLIG